MTKQLKAYEGNRDEMLKSAKAEISTAQKEAKANAAAEELLAEEEKEKQQVAPSTKAKQGKGKKGKGKR